MIAIEVAVEDATIESSVAEKTYGRQLEEHHHRRNRPYTFLSYMKPSVTSPPNIIFSSLGGIGGERSVGIQSNSYPTANFQPDP